ncbi:MAG TPA: CDP-glucose 4,6-dehydratase [Chlamydiales bacterium]|nr:CDP-glucose 4,6-dehydratase [Chlamydiales bacterium]
MHLNQGFWDERRVLLTGHTGFKGAWMALLLEKLGAEIMGVSLPPPTQPNLYETLFPWSNLSSSICDIRNQQGIAEIIYDFDPEIVIHMAAQPLVRESYKIPVETIETNVMGTVHLLESLRTASNLEAILVITTDKVYAHQKEALDESASLGGQDPYSASKAAVEIITAAYDNSFFNQLDVKLCTARAGNVIGGGDWAKDRILPDLWRSYQSGQPVTLRYPEAVRPWQHVLDPLFGYLLYLEYMVEGNEEYPRALNFGPPIEPLRTVLEVAKKFSSVMGSPSLFILGEDPKYKENQFLLIDASLAKQTLGWRALLDVDTAILWTCEWYKAYRDGKDMRKFSNEQLMKYLDFAQIPAASI